ncbi:unnamed protein product [Schistosoma curassoni]|uniref:Transposase n=1 Tax=Schistosoma curassoni TaxID=6186 RepID=A0A183KCI7_9TREM|nr:unnamed protein product [Schistosoma curassoni]
MSVGRIRSATTYCGREQTNFQLKRNREKTLERDRTYITEIIKLHQEASPSLES